MLTTEDYKKIEQYLLSRSVKDSELPVSESLNDKDTIAIIQNNKNVRIPISTFISDVSYMGLSNIYNVSILSNNYNLSLQEAIELIPRNARKNGIVIMYSQHDKKWAMYRYCTNDTTEYNEQHYLNTENWVDVFSYINYRIDKVNEKIDHIEGKVNTVKTFINLTENAFSNNWNDWVLNITFDELKDLVINNSIIQIQWDNKIVTKSTYDSNNNEICLKFDNIYIGTDDLFYNSIELKLTKGSSDNKINIKKDFTNVKGNTFTFYIKNEISLPLNTEEFSNFLRYNNIILKTDDPLNEGFFMYTSLNNSLVFEVDDGSIKAVSNISHSNYFGEVESDVNYSSLFHLMIWFNKLENKNWGIQIVDIEDTLSDYIPKVKLGKANGVASLNASGKISSNQLPSYVDDVIYVERIIDRFESSGRVDNLYYAYIGEDKTKGIYNGYINNATLIEPFYTDKIYVLNRQSIINDTTYNANSSIRWNGNKLIEIGSAHLTIGEIKGTAFDGKRGKDNEDTLNSHINNKTNPHKVTKVQIGLNNVTNDAQVKRSEMDVANGVAVLNANGKLKDENLDIINVPNIEDHYGILVKKNMATSDSISVAEASEIYKQFQSISPKSNNCIIKAGSASNVDGTVQYSISAENNPKFSEVLDAYNRGANIILDTFVDTLKVDRHRINITNWTYNNSNTLNGVVFACEDFNNQKIDVTIIKSGDNIQGNFKILNNFANERLAGLMSAKNYTDIIDCQNTIIDINQDIAKLKQIDNGDGEIIVTGGISPFISEMTNDGFNINCRYSSPILEMAGEENITIPIAGNTTPGLLPKGYKNKIDVTALKVNTLDNFGLVGRILVKSDPDGFIDKTSTVYLLTGDSDIANFDTATSSRERASIEIPKTTIQISNIGIEYVSTNGIAGFTVTTSKEVDKFIININKVELQNNQPIIINLYNFN